MTDNDGRLSAQRPEKPVSRLPVVALALCVLPVIDYFVLLQVLSGEIFSSLHLPGVLIGAFLLFCLLPFVTTPVGIVIAIIALFLMINGKIATKGWTIAIITILGAPIAFRFFWISFTVFLGDIFSPCCCVGPIFDF